MFEKRNVSESFGSTEEQNHSESEEIFRLRW